MEDEKDKDRTGKSAGEFAGARRAVFPSYFPPMLASLSENPFSGTGWIYEPKMDGMRCIAFVDGDRVKLLSRRGQNITAQYPALAATLPSLCKCSLVLDGEIIALNEQGRPSFQLLQKRMNLQKVADISRADARIPVHYFVFDTVHAQDFNLARCALVDRKRILNNSLTPAPQVILLKHFEDDGRIAYEACIENGFEGIVAKRRDSPYEVGRRSPYWVKVKAQKSSEFVIGGYSAGQGGRSDTFGSLVLGYYNDSGSLIYAGSVGTGFDERLLAEMMRRMDPLKSTLCPFAQKPEDKKDATWLRPELVAEIKFMDFTDDLHLRNPVFLHLRHDIQASEVRIIKAMAPSEILVQAAGTREAGAADSPTNTLSVSESAPAQEYMAGADRLDLEIQHWQSEAQSVIAQLSGKERNMPLTVEHSTISLTNLDKILFPATEFTKAVSKREFLKLIAFLSPYLLSHIHNRPLTMIRAPSGMRSRSFYQKHWNLDIPDFIETIRPECTDPTRKDQLLCNNVAALIFLAQHNILEYHCWLSRVEQAEGEAKAKLARLEFPDYMVFDIDIHKEGEKDTDKLDQECFNKARQAAFRLQEILQQLGLLPFLKTSGRNGLHLFIPIKPEFRFEEVRTLAETIARHAETRWPDLVSTSAIQARKENKVFLDYQANTRGKTLAAPYTPRLTPTATISTPIAWNELSSSSPEDFTQDKIRERLKGKKDIWKDILSHREDLSNRFTPKSKT